MEELFEIKAIVNTYGSLVVKTEGSRHFWGIEDYDGFDNIDWHEIPDYLYEALKRYREEQN